MGETKTLASSAKKKRIIMGCSIAGGAIIMAGTGIGAGYAIWHKNTSEPQNKVYSAYLDSNNTLEMIGGTITGTAKICVVGHNGAARPAVAPITDGFNNDVFDYNEAGGDGSIENPWSWLISGKAHPADTPQAKTYTARIADTNVTFSVSMVNYSIECQHATLNGIGEQTEIQQAKNGNPTADITYFELSDESYAHIEDDNIVVMDSYPDSDTQLTITGYIVNGGNDIEVASTHISLLIDRRIKLTAITGFNSIYGVSLKVNDATNITEYEGQQINTSSAVVYSVQTILNNISQSISVTDYTITNNVGVSLTNMNSDALNSFDLTITATPNSKSLSGSVTLQWNVYIYENSSVDPSWIPYEYLTTSSDWTTVFGVYKNTNLSPYSILHLPEDCLTLDSYSAPYVDDWHSMLGDTSTITGLDIGHITNLKVRFDNCSSLVHVDISSVSTLNINQFDACTNLETVKLNPSIAVLPRNCFKGDTKMQITNWLSLTGLHTYDYMSLYQCNKMVSAAGNFVIPYTGNDGMSIGNYAFGEMSSMKIVWFGTLKFAYEPYYIFYGDSALESVGFLPSSDFLIPPTNYVPIMFNGSGLEGVQFWKNNSPPVTTVVVPKVITTGTCTISGHETETWLEAYQTQTVNVGDLWYYSEFTAANPNL